MTQDPRFSGRYPSNYGDHRSTVKPKKRRRPILWFAIGVVALFFVGCTVLAVGTSTPNSVPNSAPGVSLTPNTPAASAGKVTFRVEGKGKAEIIYMNGQDQTTLSDQPLPWSETIESDEFAHSLTVTRSIQGGASSPMICSIQLDDKDPKRSTATGRNSACTVFN